MSKEEKGFRYQGSREITGFGKRVALGEVSILGKRVYLEELDLSKLIGGKAFTVPSKIAFNGYSISTNSLADSGANGSIFIDTRLAIDAAKFFGTYAERLPTPCGTKGFDGASGNPITHVIFLHLWVDGRRFLDVPMLVANLGQHSMIIGRNWFAEKSIWLDPGNRRLIWPEDRTQAEEIQEKLNVVVPREILKRPFPDSIAQRDADRRDKLMDAEDRRAQRYRVPRTEKMDRRDGLMKMSRALEYVEPADPPERDEPRRDLKNLPVIDIAAIGAAAFHRHTKRKHTEIFITSLHEIDRIINEKKNHMVDSDEQELLQKLPVCYQGYEDVFSKKESDTLPPFRKGVDYKIGLEEGADPNLAIGHSPLFKQNAEELEAAKQYLMDNLNKGFIVPSSAPFASPILMARMPTGKLRFCVDYRKLNAISKKDRYPIPLIDELMERLNGAKIFTKLDIRQGFHRIRMDPDSEDLTTFRTRYGAYKYKVVPFGITNGPAVFQRFVNSTFFDYLDKFLTAFVDDLLIYSRNMEEHQEHVRLVLERLRNAGLQASISKCEFHVTRTKYLGFIITTEGVEVDPEKVSVIQNWAIPTTVRGVQSFLGFCNFYRRFIKNYSGIAKALYRLTRQNISFEWTPECQRTFEQLKDSLTQAPVLRHYQPDLPTRVETDASDGAIAGVLSQQDSSEEWHPVAYYSRSMSAPEKNYEIHDKEMLAVIRALEEWRAELEGLQRKDRFEILTDHRALEYFMATKKLNARQARWAQFLSRFYFLIKYRPGKQNTLADALSRPEKTDLKMDDHRMQILLRPESLDDGIKQEVHKVTQPSLILAPLTPELNIVDRVLMANRTAPSLDQYRKKVGEEGSHWTLDEGRLLYQNRLVVSVEEDPTLKTHLLNEIHKQASTAHPGRNKTRELVKRRYYWPTWRSDVDRYVRNCSTCRRTTNPKDKIPGLLQPLPIPARPWQHISMDFHSFPKDERGYDAALVVVDRLGKRVITIPCHRTATARDVAELFLVHVYRHYGAPDSIVSDRGPQFISSFWGEFCKILGINLKLSTADHPQTDGQTEIMNQYITQRLRPFVNYYQENWSGLLPIMDHAEALLTNESTGVSPFLVDRGYEPRTSFDWRPLPQNLPREELLNREAARERINQMKDVWEHVRNRLGRAQDAQRKQANRHRRKPDFDVGDRVWLSLKHYRTGRPNKKLDYQSAGPFEIVKKIGHAFELKLPPGMKIHPVFSPDKLRLAANDPLPGQLEEPGEPVEIDGENEWEVERILASRMSRGKLQYRAKWIGFDDDPAWYPARNFKGSPHKIRDFHQENPSRSGPPKRLAEWLRAWEADEDLADVVDDDSPA